jgi:hypothetical protein
MYFDSSFDKFIIYYHKKYYGCNFHNWKGTSKNGSRFGQLSFDDHEQIVFCNDKDTGLKAIIGIHNSVMGPALGELECLMLMNGLLE